MSVFLWFHSVVSNPLIPLQNIYWLVRGRKGGPLSGQIFRTSHKRVKVKNRGKLTKVIGMVYNIVVAVVVVVVVVVVIDKED